MDAQPELEQIEEILGYTFEDPSLLATALTHSSVKTPETPSNERLEFLGDAVLGLVVAHHLHAVLPASREGRLSTLRSQIVRESTLGRAFDDLGLVPYLRIQPDMIRDGGSPPRSVLENAFEAVVGALYLDGGLEAAGRLVLRALAPAIERARQRFHDGNWKAMLQQISQGRGGELPEYRVLETAGPEHERSFEVAVEVGELARGTGSGRSKKAAEQAAARDALLGMWQRGVRDLEDATVRELALLFGDGGTGPAGAGG